MKSPKHAGKAAKKLPPSKRPAVLYRYQYEDADVITDLAPAKDDDFAAATCSIVLVLPMPTLSAAKKALKWAKLGEEQKVEAIAKALYNLDTANAERRQSEMNSGIRTDSFLYDRTQYQCWGHRSLDCHQTDGMTTHERYQIRARIVLKTISP
jgi:outer membrane receptor for monomeric catechols